MRRVPALLRRPLWRFHSFERLADGGSITLHVHLFDSRVERRRVRVRGVVAVAYAFSGEPCFSPQEAASRLALAPPLPSPERPRQLELLA